MSLERSIELAVSHRPSGVVLVASISSKRVTALLKFSCNPVRVTVVTSAVALMEKLQAILPVVKEITGDAIAPD